MFLSSIFAGKIKKNPINLEMEHKYRSKKMNNKFLKNTNLIKLVFFLFLGMWSVSAKAQCSPDIDPNYSNCTGDSIQITAASGFNYSWSTGDTTQSIWVTSSDSIWVVITDSICVVDSSSFFNPTSVSILNVNIFPEDTTICSDESLILSVNTTSNILWNTGDVIGSFTITPPSNNISVYYVDVTENGSTCRDSVSITVLPEVIINTVAINNNSSQNACDGQIFPSVSGFMPLNYQWSAGGFILPNSVSGVIDSLCENTYCLTVTDANNCSVDTCVNVEWNSCNLDLSISNPILCNGETASVNVVVDTTAGIGPFVFANPRFEYSIYSLNPLNLVQFQPFGLSLFTFNNNLVAGEYLVTVYDKSWQDSCSNNITITEPDPILIHTTINNTSATWNNDGSILIDSITGGVGGFLTTWYDSSYTQSFPGTAILLDSLLLDSIYFSHDYYGGYSILVTDTNGCEGDTTLYVYPDSTMTDFDTVYVSQHETCFGLNDGKLFASMNDSAIPPFTFYWMELSTGIADTIRIDCMGCPPPSNYNPSHVATHTNLPPGPYALTVSDALGNSGELIDLIIINPADSIYVVINPNLDSITLNCSESILLSAIANPLPNSASLMPYTEAVFSAGANPTSSFVLDLSTNSGISFSLYDSPNRTYSLTCSGTATDTSIPAVNYDAAFMNWPTTPTSHNVVWGWNVQQGNNVPLLNTSMYDGVNHSYTWIFSANSNSAPNNALIPGEYLHEFRVNNTIFTGQLTCNVDVIIDTIIYNYSWVALSNIGDTLSFSDTLLTDSSVIITTDYMVSVSNSNGCKSYDTIRVKKDLNTLSASVIVTDVVPCYGDSTGVIDINITDSSGVSPFIYLLFASDTSFIESSLGSSFSGLYSGQYFIQVQDTIGCNTEFYPAFIDQPDTIFACGVDEKLDTTFNIFSATVLANDPSTWAIQSSVLAPNFQYILEVSGTFGLTSLQFNAAQFDQDAAYNLNPLIVNPNPGPFWTVDGNELRPDVDVLNTNNTYFYYNPSDVNGTGPQNDYFTGSGMPLSFVFNDPDGDTTNNQGSLTFTLHKISCTQTDTAYTCKGESLGFAFVRPASVNGSLGGIPFNNSNGVYYETEWVQYNPITGANIATIQGGAGAGPSDTIVNLSAGSYRVFVIDSLGCSEFVRYLEVLEPIDTFITILDTVIHVSCKYDSTGEIHLSNFGGFDSIATNGTSIVPIASTTSRYAVLLRDNAIYNACGDVNTIIPQADYSDTIISFYGVLDSIIFDNLTAHRYRVYIYDSIPDATYGQYDPFTGQLLASSFNYLQCPNIIDVFISEPCDSLSAFTSVLSNVNCWGDSTGKAYVSAFGGAEPWTYTYQWHNAPFGVNNLGEENDTAYHLWADTLNSFPNTLWHTVTVTDLNGCTFEDSVEIKHVNKKIRPFYVNAIADTIWEIKFIEDSVSCFNLCDGEVALETFGGVYPHQYVWDVNPTTIIYNQPDTVDGLCAGGHDVLVQDNVGCQQRIRFGINKPNELFAVASEVSPISCFGFNDGTAHAFGIGGNNVNNLQSAYTFNWFIDSLTYNTNDSLLGVGQNIDSLPPGIHIVQVTDYKGCVATDTVEIIEPTQLSVVIVDSLIVYAYCEYTESAKLCAQAFGGTPGYVYQWDDAYFQNNSSSALFENSPFCADNLTPININTNDGSYNVIVIDERGCVASETIDIDTITNTFNSNTISVSVSDVTCFNGFNGSITIDSIIGGTPGYNFLWSGLPGFSQTLQNIGTLVASSYAVIITDSMNCQRTKNIIVNEPDQLYYSIYNSIDETCTGDGSTANSNGSCDGQIMVNVFGGTGSYYYSESESNVFPISFSDTITIINDTLIKDLCNGLHYIYLTDDNRCDGQVFPGGIGSLAINTLVNVGVPGVNWTPTTCSYSNDGTASMQFPGADTLFDYSWETTSPPTSIVGTGASVSNLSIGNYVLVAHYGNDASFGVFYPGCDATEPFTISGPLEIVPVATVASVTCWGDNDGSINLFVSGGTPAITGPGYTYQWDNTVSLPSGATTPSVNNLLAGTYGVTITDANGCDTTLAILITQPSQIQNDFTITNLLCNNDATGSITPITSGGTPTGGNPSYIYGWGGINPLAVQSGTYSVTITDANGCSIIDEATVEEPNPLLLSLTTTNNYGVSSTGVPYFISCNGANDGEVLAITTGGLEPYSYAWSDLQTTNPAISLSVGSITLDVTDANGCPVTASITLTEPSVIIDNSTLSTNSYGYEVSCFGASDGWISLNPTGGVPESNGSYSYNWSSSSSLDSVSSEIMAGNYSVSIVDANGCSYSFNYTLISPSEAFNASVSTLNYAGPSHPPVNVIFTDATVDNLGNPVQVNHNWYWTDYGAAEPFTNSGFQTFTHIFTELGANDVYVLIQNADNGCMDTVNFIIEVQGIDYTTNVFSPNGDGINDEFVFDEFGIKVISVEIYNRWGSLVMNWTDLDKGWDGRGADGQDLPDAVYFYVLTAEGEDGHYYENKGSITLLR